MFNDQRTARIRTMALRTLAVCSTRKGIIAGTSHFYQVWTRDACFALWGSITVSDHETIRITLTRLTDSIDNKGRVPLRIGDHNMIIPFLKAWFYKKIMRKESSWFMTRMKIKDNIVYEDDKKNSYALDSGLLLIIAWALTKIILEKKDFDNIASTERLELLEKSFENTMRYEKFGLLYQEPYSDWADSIKRRGYCSYNNILYYAAAKSLSLLIEDKKEYYNKKSSEIKSLINKRLWKNNQYIDFLTSDYSSPNFTLDANMLAILFNIADSKKREKIFNKIKNNKIIIQKTGITIYPYYKNNHISRFIKLIGMKKYHNGMQWLWISGLTIIALQNIKNKDTIVLLDNIIEETDKLTENNREEHGLISEVYMDNKPFRNMFYESEEPFAWSSGMLIAALDKQQKIIKSLQTLF